MSDKKFYSDGLKFKCQQCSYCCRHEPGYIFFTHDELEKMSDYLSITKSNFIRKYTKIVDLGITSRYTIVEKPNNDCIFWEKSGCVIYEVRPFQCKSYPFWSSIVEEEKFWQEESKTCPGMNKGEVVDSSKIEKLLKQREEEIFLSPGFKELNE